MGFFNRRSEDSIPVNKPIPVKMKHPEADAQISCLIVEPTKVEIPKQAIDPLLVDQLMQQISDVLGPNLNDSDLGLMVENEKYSISLLKTGAVKIMLKE